MDKIRFKICVMLVSPTGNVVSIISKLVKEVDTKISDFTEYFKNIAEVEANAYYHKIGDPNNLKLLNEYSSHTYDNETILYSFKSKSVEDKILLLCEAEN